MWVKNVNGNLVNLSACISIFVRWQTNSVCASENGNNDDGYWVLKEFPTRPEAEAYRDELFEQLKEEAK